MGFMGTLYGTCMLTMVALHDHVHKGQISLSVRYINKTDLKNQTLSRERINVKFYTIQRRLAR